MAADNDFDAIDQVIFSDEKFKDFLIVISLKSIEPFKKNIWLSLWSALKKFFFIVSICEMLFDVFVDELRKFSEIGTLNLLHLKVYVYKYLSETCT